MLRTDRNVKCARSHLQPAVPTSELQILDLQVLVATLLVLVTTLKSLQSTVLICTENTFVLTVNPFFQQVDKDKAILLALHYLKKKTLSDVTIKKLKPALKTCIPCMKDSAKETLLSSLKRVLFERKIVVRKDSRDVITHRNLKTVK